LAGIRQEERAEERASAVSHYESAESYSYRSLGDLAAAFAFAIILALATLFAGFATTLAFAAIHSFAIVFVHGGIARAHTRVVRLAAGGGQRAADESRHGGGKNYHFCSACFHILLFVVNCS
jgi:hypothetical protein